MSRSRDTEGSPASILATLDWLDFTRLARSPWVSRRRARHSRSFDASLILSSTYAASSGERLRNSAVLPTLQPLASRRFLFDSRIVVAPKTLPARLDHRLGSPRRFLAEDLQDHDGIGVTSIDDPPRESSVLDAQFMASWSNRRHRSRMGHTQQLALLQPSEKKPSLEPGRGRKGRSFDLPVEPDKRPVRRSHTLGVYVIFDISSSSSFCQWSNYRIKLAVGPGTALAFHLRLHLALMGQTPAERLCELRISIPTPVRRTA